MQNTMLRSYVEKIQTNNDSLRAQLGRQEIIITRLSNEIEQVGQRATNI